MNTLNSVSPTMQTMIKQWEGLRLTAYRCPGGVLTIGYGHTGNDVVAGMTITPRQADDLFAADIALCARTLAAMLEADAIAPMPQNRFDALASLAFNIGTNGLRRSTLWRKLRNGRPVREIAAEFNRWVFAGGRKVPGLVSRRAAESKFYLATPK